MHPDPDEREPNEAATRMEPTRESDMLIEANPDPQGTGPKRVRAVDVLGPHGVVQIEHEGEIYTLRLTRNNRLILTK